MNTYVDLHTKSISKTTQAKNNDITVLTTDTTISAVAQVETDYAFKRKK